jgi:hypothetical protein
MSDAPSPSPDDEVEVVAPDGVDSGPPPEPDAGAQLGNAVTEPAKVMRIGSMVKLLLEEVRSSDLDEPSRERLAEVYERSIIELSDALSPDLQEELRSLSLPFDHDEVPSEAELRVAKAQLVGWLEGLFHGIQASMMAQQFARQQSDPTRQLPGPTLADDPTRPNPDRPGTYL